MATDSRTVRILTAATFIVVVSAVLASCGGGGPGVVVRGPYQRGNTAYADGDLDGAIEQFGLALDSDPEDYRVHYNLGLAYHDKARLSDDAKTAGDYRELAEASYRRVLAISPGNARAISALAIITRETDGLDAAIAYLEEAASTESKESRGSARWTLGTLYRDAGRTEDARTAWRQVLTSDPTHRESVTALSASLVKDEPRDPRAAEELLTAGLVTHPYDFSFRLLHAQIALARAEGRPYSGDDAKAWDDAYMRYRKAQALLSSHWAVGWGLGRIHEAMGDDEAAVAAYWTARGANELELMNAGVEAEAWRADVERRIKALYGRLATSN